MPATLNRTVPDWDDHEVVEEVYSFIDPRNPNRWSTLGPAEALRFFDPLFWSSVLGADSSKPKKCKMPFKTFRPFKEHAVRCLVHITVSRRIRAVYNTTRLTGRGLCA